MVSPHYNYSICPANVNSCHFGTSRTAQSTAGLYMHYNNILMVTIIRVRHFLEMIKFSHTVFALPFALSSAVIAAEGLPTVRQLFWIVVAMVGARTGAMAFNRLVDARIDAENPRTRNRHIPAGLVGRAEAATYVAVSFGLLVFSAWNLNRLAFMLSPLVVLLLMSYSFCKRFTSLSHLVLGLCLGAAPIGAWIALRGDVTAVPIVMCAAVMAWVAGFDIIYALQDLEFDRQAGLHSLPVRFGAAGALAVARGLHVITVLLLGVLQPMAGFTSVYLAGIAVIAGLLVYEHRLVKPDDLSRVDAAFFNMNGYISVLFFMTICVDIMLRNLL